MNNLIFLNGNIPIHVYNKLFRGEKNFIIAADGGANHLKENGIKADFIAGDLDSIKKDVLKYYKSLNTVIKKIPEQETTDFEKVLNYCSKNKSNNLKIFGAVSERTDHTLNNFSVLKRYFRKLNITLYSDEFEIYFVKGISEFAYKKGNTVSLLPFPKAYSVKTKGLKYSLSNENLELGKREGSLNISVSDKVSVGLEKGFLLLFKKHFINKPKN